MEKFFLLKNEDMVLIVNSNDLTKAFETFQSLSDWKVVSFQDNVIVLQNDCWKENESFTVSELTKKLDFANYAFEKCYCKNGEYELSDLTHIR